MSYRFRGPMCPGSFARVSLSSMQINGTGQHVYQCSHCDRFVIARVSGTELGREAFKGEGVGVVPRHRGKQS